jgi:hypothetical protein
VDIVVRPLLGQPGFLVHHRGITHSLAGFAVLAAALAALLAWIGRPRGHASRAGPLAAVAGAGLLSHLALDWINTYGIRPWLPFSEARYYLDAIYIVDPILWAIFGAAVVLGHRVGARAAIAATVLAPLYIGGAAAISARAAALPDPIPGETARMASPLPLTPFRRLVLLASDREVRFVGVDVLAGLARPPARTQRVMRNLDDPALASVAGTPEYAAWRCFARFPFVARDATGRRLILGDARYDPSPTPGWCNLSPEGYNPPP